LETAYKYRLPSAITFVIASPKLRSPQNLQQTRTSPSNPTNQTAVSVPLSTATLMGTFISSLKEKRNKRKTSKPQQSQSLQRDADQGLRDEHLASGALISLYLYP
jgi:hypothetical protein